MVEILSVVFVSAIPLKECAWNDPTCRPIEILPSFKNPQPSWKLQVFRSTLESPLKNPKVVDAIFDRPPTTPFVNG